MSDPSRRDLKGAAPPKTVSRAGTLALSGIIGPVWFTTLVVVQFVMVGFFAVDDGTPLHPWAGLIQRVLCAVWFTWEIVLASRLWRLFAGSAAAA